MGEELDNGDRKIHFVGMTGALAATGELRLDEMAEMDPEHEIPRIFQTWDLYVREAGICSGLAELEFLEVHSFGAAPKSPDPRIDPEGYSAQKQRIRQAYSDAYAKYWAQELRAVRYGLVPEILASEAPRFIARENAARIRV